MAAESMKSRLFCLFCDEDLEWSSSVMTQYAKWFAIQPTSEEYQDDQELAEEFVRHVLRQKLLAKQEVPQTIRIYVKIMTGELMELEVDPSKGYRGLCTALSDAHSMFQPTESISLFAMDHTTEDETCMKELDLSALKDGDMVCVVMTPLENRPYTESILSSPVTKVKALDRDENVHQVSLRFWTGHSLLEPFAMAAYKYANVLYCPVTKTYSADYVETKEGFAPLCVPVWHTTIKEALQAVRATNRGQPIQFSPDAIQRFAHIWLRDYKHTF